MQKFNKCCAAQTKEHWDVAGSTMIYTTFICTKCSQWIGLTPTPKEEANKFLKEHIIQANKITMELNGRLTAKLAEQRGTSKAGKDWVKQDFIIETNDKFPKSVCIGVMGEDKIKLLSNVAIGEDLTCSINIESREYNGRWYTSVSAWKIDLVGRGQATPPIEESSTIFHSSGIDDSGLPF